MKLVWIAKDVEGRRDVYSKAIADLCPTNGYCYLLFWSSRDMVPKSMPMTEKQADAQVAAYTFNPTNGFKQLLLSCRLDRNPNECF